MRYPDCLTQKQAVDQPGISNMNRTASVESATYPPPEPVPEENPLDEQDAVSEKPKKRDMFGHEILDKKSDEDEHRTALRNETIGGDEEEPDTQFLDMEPGEALTMPIIKEDGEILDG